MKSETVASKYKTFSSSVGTRFIEGPQERALIIQLSISSQNELKMKLFEKKCVKIRIEKYNFFVVLILIRFS